MLGNSSSGLTEAPSFGIPTVNIGNRQRGRIQAESVINCGPEKDEILRALERACSPDFRKTAAGAVNPPEGRNTAEEICKMEPLVAGGYASYKLVTLQIANRENNYLL